MVGLAVEATEETGGPRRDILPPQATKVQLKEKLRTHLADSLILTVGTGHEAKGRRVVD